MIDFTVQNGRLFIYIGIGVTIVGVLLAGLSLVLFGLVR